MFATLCWQEERAIVAKERKPTSFKIGQNWAGKTWFHGLKWQRVTDRPSQCFNGAAYIALLPGASHMGRAGENNKVAGQPFQRTELPRKEIQGEVPTCERPSRSSSPFVPGKTFWQGWWLQGTTNEGRHMYYAKEKEGEGGPQEPTTTPAGSGLLLRSAPRTPPSPATKGRRRVQKLFRRARDSQRR